MDKFDSEILNTFRNEQTEVTNDYLDTEQPNNFVNTNSFINEETKYLIVCLPRTKIEEVEVYLRSRNIDNYDTCFNINEFSEIISNPNQYNVYLFDFIGDTRIIHLLSNNVDKISDLNIFTNKDNIAELGKKLTDKVYILSKLMDILTLFWDSDVFSYDNVLNAHKHGVELVNKRALEIQGKKLDKLELSFSVEKEKTEKYSSKVSYINIEKKFQGKDIGKVRKGNIFKRAISNLFNNYEEDFEEEYHESEQLYSNEEMSYMDEETMYKLENNTLTDVLSKMKNSVYSGMSDYLLKKGIITEEVAKHIENLKELKQISGIFCEVDYAISIGAIDEVSSINLVNDYYKMYCLQFEDVLSSVVLSDFKFEGCLEFKCFPTRGMLRDVNYFVIDPDNEYGKRKIEEMFNNFEYVYTKEKYIVEKLNRMRGDFVG